MRVSAAAQMTAIERKMTALPADRGPAQGRRRRYGHGRVAHPERRRGRTRRLVEQARREIDAQLKLAERALVARTADLAVEIAATRVRATITAEDQARLVDR